MTERKAGAESIEIAPDACTNGHPWPLGKGGHVLVGWKPCDCRGQRFGETTGGHRTYDCLSCDDVIYRPPHDESADAGPKAGGQLSVRPTGSQGATEAP